MADINNVLRDFIATYNDPKSSGDMNKILPLFPELKGYDSNILVDYVATYNDPKSNGDFDIVNSKFPELFPEQRVDASKSSNPVEADQSPLTPFYATKPKTPIEQMTEKLGIPVLGEVKSDDTLSSPINQYDQAISTIQKDNDRLRQNLDTLTPDQLKYAGPIQERLNANQKELERIQATKVIAESGQLDYTKESIASQQERLNNQYKNTLDQIKKAGLGSSDNVNRERQVKYLDTAYKLLSDAEEVINAPSKTDGKNVFGKFFKGAGSTLSDQDFWSLGVTDIVTNARIAQAAEKLERGEKISEAEDIMLDAAANKVYAEYVRAFDTSAAYRGGAGLIESLGFMAEMAATGGLVKAGTKGVQKALSKVLGTKIKNMLGGVVRAAETAASTTSGQATAAQLLTKAGLKTAQAAGAAIIAPSTAEGTARRMTGEIQADDTTESIQFGGIENKMGFGEAYVNSVEDTFKEFLSEGGGGSFSVLGKFLNKVPVINKAFTSFASTKFGQISKYLGSNQYLKQIGFHGFIGEWNEELDVALYDAVFKGGDLKEDFFNKDTQSVLLWTLLPMSAFSTGMNGVTGSAMKRRYVRSEERLDQILAEQGFGSPEVKEIKSELLSATPETINRTLSKIASRIEGGSYIIDGETYINKDVLNPLMEYTKSANSYDAFNNGLKTYKENLKQDIESERSIQEKVSKFMTEVEEEVKVSDRMFTPGELDASIARSTALLESTIADKTKIDKVKAILSGKDKMTPEQLLASAMKDESFDVNDLFAIKTYYVAMRRLDARNQKIAAEAKKAEANAIITVNAQVNPDMGAIVTAKNGEEIVTVSGGKVSVNEDGTVDHNNTDDTLYVKTEVPKEDGTVEVVVTPMPKSNLNEVTIVDPQQASQEAAAAAREKVVNEMKNQDTAPYEVGETIRVELPTGIAPGVITEVTDAGYVVNTLGGEIAVEPRMIINETQLRGVKVGTRVQYKSAEGVKEGVVDDLAQRQEGLISIDNEIIPVESVIGSVTDDIIPADKTTQETTKNEGAPAVEDSIKIEETEETAQVDIPVKKDGTIDFDSISDPKVMAAAANQLYEGEALSIITEEIAYEQSNLEEASKIKRPTERSIAVKKVQARIDMLNQTAEILQQTAPVAVETAPAETAQPETSRVGATQEGAPVAAEAVPAAEQSPVRDKAWEDKAVASLPISEFTSESLTEAIESGQFIMITAENPNNTVVSEDENAEFNSRLVELLKKEGYQLIPIVGRYDGKLENSFLVLNATKETAVRLINMFNQESVATHEGLYYQDGSYNPRVYGGTVIGERDDYYSVVKLSDGTPVKIGVDYNTDEIIEKINIEEYDTEARERIRNNGERSTVDGELITTDGQKSTGGVGWVKGGPGVEVDRFIYSGKEYQAVRSTKDFVWYEDGNVRKKISKAKVLIPVQYIDESKLDLQVVNNDVDQINDGMLVEEVYFAARKLNMELLEEEAIALGAAVKAYIADGDPRTLPQIIQDITEKASFGKVMGKFVEAQEIATDPDGSTVSTPNRTYNEAVSKNPNQTGENLWVRQSNGKTNKDRTLMIQISSTLSPAQRSRQERYFDKLYRLIPGYDRSTDFWEVPTWMGRIAAINPNTDVYVVRNIEEAQKLISEAGYGNVLFSAMDAVKMDIKAIIDANPNQKFEIGVYTPFRELEGYNNVTTFKTVEEYAEKNGLEYKYTYNYRQFEGTSSIPRLRTSEGCRYKCAFCSNLFKVSSLDRQTIMDQVDGLKGLDMKYVYIGDKAFGQADNREIMFEVYERIKAFNPNFEGFIVQTAAADFANEKRFSKEYLERAHIAYVELGVETLNDDILAKLNKRHSSRKYVDKALDNARKNGVKIIPNLIIGLSGKNKDGSMWSETRDTYMNTINWLKENQDIISHTNVYALALYEGTELGDEIGAKIEADRNENIVEKSFLNDPAVHAWAMNEIITISNELLERQADPVKALSDTYISRLQKLKESNPAKYWSVDMPSKEVINEAAADGRIVDVNGGMGIVTKSGNMVGLFKYVDSAKGTAKSVQEARIKLGGNRLDVYDVNGMVENYSKTGFREVARIPFNEKYAPDDMPKEAREAKPDVVFMIYDPNNTMPVSTRTFKSYDAAKDYTYGLVKKHPNRSANTQGFFSDVVTGKSEKFKPLAPWSPILNFSDAERQFKENFDRFNGNFDIHIATSIPGFRDVQIKTGNAVLKLFGNKGGLIYDIGGSEGGWIKAISSASEGRVRSINLDPNPDMNAVFDRTPVPNSTFIPEAFFEGFDNFKAHEPKQKADVVHESMTFQFISNERRQFVEEVKQKYIKPGGIFLTEEKLMPESMDQFVANEEVKDTYFKSKYYTTQQLKTKAEEVLVGMTKDMSSKEEYVQILKDNFAYVYEYWDSGNFKGYIATDNKEAADKFLAEVGDTDTMFAEKNIPTKGVEVADSQIRPSSETNLPDDVHQHMTEDGKGNYLFFHYGDFEGNIVDSSKGTRHAYTGDVRISTTSNYYTKPSDRERMVSGTPHIVRVPKHQVYPFNSDPNNYYEEAREMFKNSVWGSNGQAFTWQMELSFITKIAIREGYKMIVSKWNDTGIRLKAETPLPMESMSIEEFKAERGPIAMKFEPISSSALNDLIERLEMTGLGKVASSGEFEKMLAKIMDGSIARQTVNEMQSIKDEAISNGTFMKAPNGRPTNLNENQWLQIRTRAFKEWFGDWETGESSKLLDDNGEPMVVYRGHNKNVSPVETRNTLPTFTENSAIAEAYADVYPGVEGTVTSAFVSMKNPHVLGDNDGVVTFEQVFEILGQDAVSGMVFSVDGEFKTGREVIDGNLQGAYIDSFKISDMPEYKAWLIENEMDGSILYGPFFETDSDISDTYSIEYRPVSATQVKSATGNTGSFDKNNPDVMMQILIASDGYTSSVADAIDALKQSKGTPDQMKAMLLKNGAKPAELEWMGWDEFVSDKKAISKVDIQQWIDENRIEIQEVVKGVMEDDIDAFLSDELGEGFTREEAIEYLQDDDDTKYSQYVLPGGKNYKELLLTMPAVHDMYDINEVKIEETDTFWMFYDKDGELITGHSKHNVPTKEDAINTFKSNFKIDNKDVFRSSHFDEPNILAHVRFNERMMPAATGSVINPDEVEYDFDSAFELIDNGNSYKVRNRKTGDLYAASYEKRIMADNSMDEEGLKAYLIKTGLKKVHPQYLKNKKELSRYENVLFIEEIQSDWAQSGKKEGFKGDESKIEKVPYVNESDIEIAELDDVFFVQLPDGTFRHLLKDENVLTKEKAKAAFIDIFNKETDAKNASKLEAFNRNSVPNMPFKKTDQWASLVARRVIKYAAENGISKISWTTGEQQADRYDLSKQVDKISYAKNNNGTYYLLVQKDDSDIVEREEVKPSEIEEILGKEMAIKITNNEGVNTPNSVEPNLMVLSGLDLKVGGEGMKAFYNNIIPKVFKNIGKKYNAKMSIIENTPAGYNAELRGNQLFEIPSDMMNDYKGGIPMFMKLEGDVYGFAYQGKVYLNPNRMNANTPIHEFGHLWVDFIQKNHRELYERGYNLIVNTPYYDAVSVDPNYQHLSEDRKRKEAMAMAIGHRGEDIFSNKVIRPGMWNAVKAWISDVWMAVGNFFKIEDLTPERISTLTFREFTDIAVAELLSGRNLVGEKAFESDIVADVQAKNRDPLKRNDNFKFEYYRDASEFKKNVEDGLITNDKVLADFNGKKMIIIAPDNMFSGVIYYQGRAIAKGGGGIYFTARHLKDGHVWSATETSSDNFANTLNKAAEAAKNRGEESVYIAVVSGEEGKLMSNSVSVGATIDLLEYASRDVLGWPDKIIKSILNEASKGFIKNEKGKKFGYQVTLNRNKPVKELVDQLKAIASESSFDNNKAFSKLLIDSFAKKLGENTKNEDIMSYFLSAAQHFGNTSVMDRTRKISATNLHGAISRMLTEPTLQGINDYYGRPGSSKNMSGVMYAVIEVSINPDGPTVVSNRDFDRHVAYPVSIDTVNPNQQHKLHILKQRRMWDEVFIDPETGKIVDDSFYEKDGKMEPRRKKVMGTTTGMTFTELELAEQERVDPDLDIEFQLVGPKIAEQLDRVEESTKRMELYSLAREMKKAGYTDSDIWASTGWELGKDGKWRYEIEDWNLSEKDMMSTLISLADTNDVIPVYSLMGPGSIGWIEKMRKASKNIRQLAIIVDHDPNPQFKMAYSRRANTIVIPEVTIRKYQLSTEDEKYAIFNDLKSSLIHEMQHAIQSEEGFSPGSSAERGEMLTYIEDEMRKIPEIWSAYDSAKNRFMRNRDKAERNKAKGSFDLTVITAMDTDHETINQIIRSFANDKNIPLSIGEFYMRVHGEVEARNAQGRNEMTQEQRRINSPNQTADISYDELIMLREDNGLNMNYEMVLNDAGTANTAAARNQLAKDNSTIWAKLVEAHQNNVRPVLFFQRMLQRLGVKISDPDNYYMQYTSTGSKIQFQVEQFEKNIFKPFKKTISEFVKYGFSYDDMVAYSQLKHADEYTAHIQKKKFINKTSNEEVEYEYYGMELEDAIVNFANETGMDVSEVKNRIHNYIYSKVKDASEEEYAEVEAKAASSAKYMLRYSDDLAGKKAIEDRIGYSAEEFIGIIEEAAPKELIDKFWSQVKKVSDFSLDNAVRSGEMTTEMRDNIKKMFQYYVPLRGHREATAEDLYEYTGHNRQMFSPTIVKAGGRKSEASDPFAYLMQMAVSSIHSAENNILLQSWLRIAFKDKTGLLKVGKQWMLKNVDSEGNKTITPADEVELMVGESIEEYNARVEKFEADMEALKKEGKAFRSGEEKVDLGVFIKPANARKHEVSVYRNGIHYVIRFNTDPRVPEAINGNNMRNYEGAWGSLLNGVGNVTRFMAAAKTMYRPAFIFITNPLRDMYQSFNMNFIDQGPKFTAKFATNVPRAIASLIRYYTVGIDPIGSESDRRLWDYMSGGAKTGKIQMLEINDIEKKLRREVKAMGKGKIAELVNGVWDLFQKVYQSAGDITENQFRFATYLTAIDEGMSKQKAIQMAKDVTLNFDRRGSGRNMAKELRSMKAFYNVGWQALDNLYTKSTRDKYTMMRSSGVVFANMAMGYFLITGLNSMIAAMLGEDDDEWIDLYSRLPEFTRNSNIMIYTGKDNGFISLPISQELRTFYGLGSDFFMYQNGKVEPQKAATNLISGLSSMISYNPVEQVIEDNIPQLAPDVIQGMVEISANKNFLNSPIYNQWKDEQPIPGYLKIRTNRKGEPYAPEVLTYWLEQIDKATGGDGVMPGKISLNPDKVNHLMGSYFAGLYTQFISLTNTIHSEDPKGEILKAPKALWRPAKNIMEKPANLGDYFDITNNIDDIGKWMKGYEEQLIKGDLTEEEYEQKLKSIGVDNDYYAVKSIVKIIDKYTPMIKETTGSEQEKLIKEIDDMKRRVIEIWGGK